LSADRNFRCGISMYEYGLPGLLSGLNVQVPALTLGTIKSAREIWKSQKRGPQQRKRRKRKESPPKKPQRYRVPVAKVLCPRRQHSAHTVERREKGS
jgi:hypothetical protein